MSKRYISKRVSIRKGIKDIFTNTAHLGEGVIGIGLGEIILSCICSPLIGIAFFGLPVGISLIVLSNNNLNLRDCGPSLFYRTDKQILTTDKLACGVIGIGSLTVVTSILPLIPALILSQAGILIFTSRTLFFILRMVLISFNRFK